MVELVFDYYIAVMLHCVVFCCEKPQVDSQIWRAGGDL